MSETIQAKQLTQRKFKSLHLRQYFADKQGIDRQKLSRTSISDAGLRKLIGGALPHSFRTASRNKAGTNVENLDSKSPELRAF